MRYSIAEREIENLFSGVIIMSKKLYKKTNGQVICGVCNGIGDYFDIDPNVVRIGAGILACITAGSAIAVYVIAAVCLPEEKGI